jgi:hypothetical protein
MRKLAISAASLLAAGLLVSPAVGGKPVDPQAEEQAVFVTGSLIPQRIKLKRIGTATVSPIRVIDRREIDQRGRRTTAGILVTDPSIRVVGH